MSTSVIDKIPDVDIDDRGRYKYILIKVADQNVKENPSKYIVRGGRLFEFHVEIYDYFKKSVKPDDLNVTTRILGGGFLDHGENSIRVEGSSMQFGAADHSISAGVLMKAFPDLRISFSEE